MKKIEKSLQYSFMDGIFYSIMFGFGDAYINPFAIELNATSQEIGLLSSIPGLVSSLSQYRAAEITKKLGRKKMIMIFVFFHALMWLPILLIPWTFRSHHVFWLILFFTLYTVFGTIATPAWSSIMSQYIPKDKRGKYFSFRTKWTGSVTLVSMFIAGIFLWLNNKNGIINFTILFSISMVCRFLSWYCLSKMYEPSMQITKEEEFCFQDFIIRIKESNFVKFVFYVTLTSFAVNIGSPFFNMYILRELKFDYLSFVIITVTVTLFTLMTLTTWGKHSDKVGNLSIIKLCGFIISFLPILWLFSKSKIYLIIVNALAGFVWAGFNLSVSNFIFDAVSTEKRVRCISYFSLLNGLGICFGALIGGFLIPYLPRIKGSQLLTIFLVSGILRFIVWTYFIKKIREVRPVVVVKSKDLFFSVIGLKPIIGTSE
ncbi:MAG: MFS transporter [Endomicrobiia bacterium]